MLGRIKSDSGFDYSAAHAVRAGTITGFQLSNSLLKLTSRSATISRLAAATEFLLRLAMEISLASILLLFI